ncbi:MAG: ethanolamine ammonia-lyase subunit EutC [Acidobacteria bacterium]|nr:ethanolamine ammonia-lyase subunit EutC [Acidobacteriota bacterium]
MADSLVADDWPEIVRKIRARTPARLLAGRVGAAYRTGTQMELRRAHAEARDAVRADLDLEKQFGNEFVKRWGLFEVCSEAASKDEYLLQPGLGRTFSEVSRSQLLSLCSAGPDMQIAIGDGLSVTAMSAQVPALLPLLHSGAQRRGWSVGQAFVIRHCRVGILNEIGEILTPAVAVLLIGERPGLATAESLSAYMAYRPVRTHTDADRNLVSNIHVRGVTAPEAAARILDLAAQMMQARFSGTRLMLEDSRLKKRGVLNLGPPEVNT